MRWMPVAALIALVFLAMPASAQVHRCKDASGKLTYSDQSCAAGQSGGVIERQKSREQILEERLQAAEANERKYRAQGAERERQMFDQQQQQRRQPAATYGSQATAQDKSSSRECKEAMKKLEFVSSIRTTPKGESRLRTNAAIANVNASCGTKTELMQEQPRVMSRQSEPSHAEPESPTKPTHLTNCNGGFCYDNQGDTYHKNGADFMSGPNGKSCHRSGDMWNCN